MPPTTRCTSRCIAASATLLGQTGLLYAGDCKMAALETRAEIAANRDFYLTRLPLTGEVAAQFAAWVEAALDRRAGREAGRDPPRGGTHRPRDTSSSGRRSAVVGQTEHTWTERVQIIRSEASAQSQAAALERRLEKAEAALRGLTPPPGPGRTQFTTGWELEQAVAAVLAEHEVEGLLEVSWERRGDQPDQVRGPRPRRSEPPQDDRMERALPDHDGAARRRRRSNDAVARMGWQAQVTNVPAARLSLGDSLLAYRGGWCVERAFHLLKDQPLGIRPLFVRRDDQVQGLTHLVTLALRVLTLFEVLVRRGQEQSGEKLKGLVSRPGEADDGSSDGEAGAGGDRRGRGSR